MQGPMAPALGQGGGGINGPINGHRCFREGATITQGPRGDRLSHHSCTGPFPAHPVALGTIVILSCVPGTALGSHWTLTVPCKVLSVLLAHLTAERLSPSLPSVLG